MPHVEHRFLVHRLVLEDRVDRLGLVQQRMPGLLERRVRERIEHEGVARVGEALDLVARRPLGPLAAAGGRLVFGIDAAREQALEARRRHPDAPSPFFTSVLRLNAGRCPS